jgi:RTX calcium-binding nonapeptide repeat (4 copies)
MNANPLGSELSVNTFTANDQTHPAIAIDSYGKFAVAWESNGSDSDGTGISGRLYRPGGAPSGAEFQVNTTQDNDQTAPAIAMDMNGNFVVTWVSDRQDGGGTGVFAQRFDATKQPLGAEFRVNTSTDGDQAAPAVAMDRNGNFIVVWESQGKADRNTMGEDQSGKGIFAQRYDATGNKLGKEFRVNTTTDNDQSHPAIGLNASGEFVIAWESAGQDGDGQGVFAQTFDRSGNPTGQEFQVSSEVKHDQTNPTVAIEPMGNFEIAWQDDRRDGSGSGIYLKRFTGNGNPRGDEFRVNQQTKGDQINPTLGADSQGNLTITWASRNQDDDGYGIYARHYSPNGAASSDEFRVNTEQRNDQTEPAIAVNGVGDFVVTWVSDNQDGDNQGIFAQQYSTNAPVVTDGIEGNDRSNRLRGTLGADQINGLGGNDQLYGRAGNDQLVGGTGNDHLYGGKGNDILRGGVGRDRLEGGNGEDTLYGDSDADRLIGGNGRDIFAIGTASGADTIQDFQDKKDQIGLLEQIKFENLSIEQKGKDTWIGVGSDLIAILNNVQASTIGKADFKQL